jgi:hypothetical protein
MGAGPAEDSHLRIAEVTACIRALLSIVNGYTDVPCSHVLDVQPVTVFVQLSSVCLMNDAQARKEPDYFLFDDNPPSTRNQTSISAG